jgi:hypothetical protein
MLNLIDKVGEWNPQLFRELKGRLKFSHVAIALTSSLLLQLVVFLYQLHDIPDNRYALSEPYCGSHQAYEHRQSYLSRQEDLIDNQLNNSDPRVIPHLRAQLRQIQDELYAISKLLCPADRIDWQSWWQDHWQSIFLSLTVIFIFTLLVAGTYLLISDLAKEEQRGTLNFIRLSPQSAASILTGKLLGVPILIYLFVLAAIPFHLWAGHAAKIALSYIFSYYTILVASCILFYNSTFLFSLATRRFGSFQPWLGSGAILLYLYTTMMMSDANDSHDLYQVTAWFRLFNPWDITEYLFPHLFNNYRGNITIQTLQFFSFPVGKNLITLIGFYLLSYGLLTSGTWQAIKRCFHNPNTTILSKGQSYLFVAGSQVMFLGLAMPMHSGEETYLVLFNTIIFFGLIIILSPHRQTVQDWARYRHQKTDKSLFQDLMWGEKSPALLAIFMNLVIVAIPIMVVWTRRLDIFNAKVLLTVFLSITMMMIYATIAQLVLLMKTRKRTMWAIGILAVVMYLPAIILLLLGDSPAKNPTLWLFSSFPWVGIKYTATPTIFVAFLVELSLLILLNIQLKRQVRILGESATKALLVSY